MSYSNKNNYNYLRRACWIIASINSNLSPYLESKFQLNDSELHEITTNAFRSGINDSQFKNTKYTQFEGTNEAFDYIRDRNHDWWQRISSTIKSSELQRYLYEQTHDVLVIKKENQASLKALDEQYMLIARITKTQVQCLFDKTWYDCNSSQKPTIVKNFINNNGVFVYLKKEIKPLAVVQQPPPLSNNKPVLESRKNISDNIFTPIRLHSSPPESRQKDLSAIDTKFYQSKEPKESKFEWNKSPREKLAPNTEVIQKWILNNIRSNLNDERRTLPITSSFHANEPNVLNEKNIEKCTADSVFKLEEKLKKLVDQKFNEIEATIEHRLCKTDHENDFALTEIAKLKEDNKKLVSFIQTVLDKFKQNDQITIEIEKMQKNSSLSSEEDIKIVKENIFNDLNSKIEEKISSIESKMISDKDTIKQYLRHELENFKEETNKDIQNKFITQWSEINYTFQLKSDRTNHKCLYSEDLNKEIEKTKNENKNSLDNLKIHISDIGKILENYKFEAEKQLRNFNDTIKDLPNQVHAIVRELFDGYKERANKLEKGQDFINQQIKSMQDAIDSYKSEKLYENINNPNDSRTSYNTDISAFDHTRALPPKPRTDTQAYLGIERIGQSLPLNRLTQNVRSWNPSKSSLPNIGNTCYMNSVIQILASTTEFTKHIARIYDNPQLTTLSSLLSLINYCASEIELKKPISDFKNQISREYSMFRGRAENDAKELFVIISSQVNDEKIFTIAKNQSFTCSARQHKSSHRECSNIVTIPASNQNNIENFLKIKESKEFSGKNQLNCDLCGGILRDMTLKTESIDWPMVLTIYTPDYKLREAVPAELRIDYNHYQLFGVICYYGWHFIAFTMNDNNEWEKYDDSRASKNDPDWNKLYLAFYKKLSY